MWFLLMAVGAFGVAYIFYKIFPLTVLAIVISVGVIAYYSFGEHQHVSETFATTAGAAIVIAFGADVVMRFLGLFRSRR